MIVCDSGTFEFKSGGHLMSSRDLEELNLQRGRNRARYVCQELGEVIEFHIFLYSEEEKIVLTDIDGTITESDIKADYVHLDVEDCSEELLRQQSYAIKNQLSIPYQAYQAPMLIAGS